MAAGRPVVASDLGRMGAMVRAAGCGLVVPPGRRRGPRRRARRACWATRTRPRGWAPPAARAFLEGLGFEPQARALTSLYAEVLGAVSRVLYVSQYFVSADQPGGVRHWQHTRALARAGHEVTRGDLATCSTRSAPSPSATAGRRMVHEVEDGLDVWRTYSTPGYGRDLRSRVANYGTFAWWSALASVRAPRPDVVVASSPSLPSAAAAAALARARGARFLLEVRDLWPDSAIAMGLVSDPRTIAASRAPGVVLLPARRPHRGPHRGHPRRDVAQGVSPAADHADHQRRRPGDRRRTAAAGRRPGARRRLRGDVRRRPRHLQLPRDGARRGRPPARRPEARVVLVGGGDRKPALVEEAARRGLDERRLRRPGAQARGALLAGARGRLPAALPGQPALRGRAAEQGVRLPRRRAADHRRRRPRAS